VRTVDLSFTELDAEYLAVDPEQGYCYSFNALGMRIWRMLEASPTLAVLCSQLRQEYAVDEETCRRDLLEWLERLLADGLVQTR